MKAHKTKLISRIRLRLDPEDGENAPLAALLAENESEMDAKELWQKSGLSIEAFYPLLKKEMSDGYLVEPEKATLRTIAKKS